MCVGEKKLTNICISVHGKKGAYMSSGIFTVFNGSLTKGLNEKVILRNSLWEGKNEPCVFTSFSGKKKKESQRYHSLPCWRNGKGFSVIRTESAKKRVREKVRKYGNCFDMGVVENLWNRKQCPVI